MHFSSLLPVVGLALLEQCSAASISRRTAQQGYSYNGCYQDSRDNRQLTGAMYIDSTGMTQATCIAFCSSKGYQAAGLEYGSECYCGYQFHDAPVPLADSDCNVACAGDATKKCGGADAMSVFTNGYAAPVTNPGTGGYSLIGCYTDTPSARSLSVQTSSAGTVASCISACAAAGYPLAGVEHGSECFCDSAVRNGASVVDRGCDSVCSGNATEYCGGTGSIDIYKNFAAASASPAAVPAGWSSLGCYYDSPSARTLANPRSVAGGDSHNTVEGCLNLCQAAGYSYAGVEYAHECFCDNKINNNATLTSDQSTCHFPCSGNNAETCGGAGAMNLYSYGSSAKVRRA